MMSLFIYLMVLIYGVCHFLLLALLFSFTISVRGKQSILPLNKLFLLVLLPDFGTEKLTLNPHLVEDNNSWIIL